MKVKANIWGFLESSEGVIRQMQKSDFITAFFTNDTSPAYVKNDSLYEHIIKLISEKEIDGIIYHILKGQIEYDFELGRFEEVFEKMNIPMFRLEAVFLLSVSGALSALWDILWGFSKSLICSN